MFILFGANGLLPCNIPLYGHILFPQGFRNFDRGGNIDLIVEDGGYGDRHDWVDYVTRGIRLNKVQGGVRYVVDECMYLPTRRRQLLTTPPAQPPPGPCLMVPPAGPPGSQRRRLDGVEHRLHI
jgi:hypothetical protein